MVTQRVQAIKRQSLIMSWHHCVLNMYKYLYFEKL